MSRGQHWFPLFGVFRDSLVCLFAFQSQSAKMSATTNGLHKSLNGRKPGNDTNGTEENGFELPGVDHAQLINRLYSYAPKQATINPRQLRHQKITPAQRRTRSQPTAIKLEPLVSFLHCL